jgi:Rnl2 family RNA ligase
MKFVSYSDIENVHRLKYINNIIDHGLSYGDWVVTEKVHGSNFSFWVTNDSIKMAKRGGWIEDSEKNFYGHKDVLTRYNKNLCVLFHLISEFFNATPASINFTLYGEIFGGVYPHSDVPKSNTATRVQKGVYYSPINDFYAFDLKVNGAFINYKIFEEMMEASGFLWAKSLLISDMKTCMNYPNEFQTKIPEWLELPTIENNICEGVVIKPLDARFFPSHDRVILKNKNEKFTEVAHKKVKQKSDSNSIEIISLTDESKNLAEEASSFVTDNRLRNVLSKIGTVVDKDFGKVAGLFTQDVLKDFRKDKEEKLDSMDKDQTKLIQNHIKTLCTDMVRANFVNIIDGNF